jgi:hypothetical protein
VAWGIVSFVWFFTLGEREGEGKEGGKTREGRWLINVHRFMAASKVLGEETVAGSGAGQEEEGQGRGRE